MGPETTPRAGDKGQFTIQKPKLLLGEGRDEEEFFKAFLCHLGLSEPVQIHQYGGKPCLHGFLKALVNDPNFAKLEMLAITRDADSQGVIRAFDSISGLIRNSGLAVSAVPQRPGEFSIGPPRVGVFLMPNCQDEGMLEDSCLTSVAADGRIDCVDRFFKCLTGLGASAPVSLSKARLRCFLSAQQEDVRNLGEAAQKKIWNFEHESFLPLKEFLLQLR